MNSKKRLKCHQGERPEPATGCNGLPASKTEKAGAGAPRRRFHPPAHTHTPDHNLIPARGRTFPVDGDGLLLRLHADGLEEGLPWGEGRRAEGRRAPDHRVHPFTCRPELRRGGGRVQGRVRCGSGPIAPPQKKLPLPTKRVWVCFCETVPTPKPAHEHKKQRNKTGGKRFSLTSNLESGTLWKSGCTTAKQNHHTNDAACAPFAPCEPYSTEKSAWTLICCFFS